MVQWVEERKSKLVFQNFLGELVEYEPMTSSHKIEYPELEANTELHTARNLKADEHWINLATMEIDFASDSSSLSDNGCASSNYFSFWVDAEHIKLPFVQQRLFPNAVESTTRRKSKEKRAKLMATIESLS